MPKLGLALSAANANPPYVLVGGQQSQAIPGSGGSGESSGSSGSGSSGSGGVGLDLLNYTYEDADKLIWDYENDRHEAYANYYLKTLYSRPVVSTEITRLFGSGSFNYQFTFLNPNLSGNDARTTWAIATSPYSLNSSTARVISRPNDLYTIDSMVVPEVEGSELKLMSVQTYASSTVLRLENKNGIAEEPNRATTRVGYGAYPYVFEVINGRLWQANYNASESEFRYRTTAELETAAQNGVNYVGAYELWQSNVFNSKVFFDNRNAVVTVTTEGKLRINNGATEVSLPAAVAKENVRKAIASSAFGAGETFLVLAEDNTLYFKNHSAGDDWVVVETNVLDITRNISLGPIGIKTDYTLRKYPYSTNTYNLFPNGENQGTRKYRLIGSRYAVRHFE